MIPLLFESPLLRAAGFRHGFTSRAVDFAPGRADLARESVALALRFASDRLAQAEQVHGDRVVLVTRAEDARGEKADALVARAPGLAVGVRVADCVPILLADARSGAVAAVHAGWRGIALGIIARALEQITPTHAAIGPCIGACCFEVGADVAETIAKASSRDVIARWTGDKAFVDLRRAASAALASAALAGVALDEVPGCTRCDAELFFSHRREGARAGRHLGVIVAPG